MTTRLKMLVAALVVLSAVLVVVLVVRLSHPAATGRASSTSVITTTTTTTSVTTTTTIVPTSAPASPTTSSVPVVAPTSTTLASVAPSTITPRLTPEMVVGENVQTAAAQLRAEGFHVTLQCVEPAPYGQVVGWWGGGYGPTLYFGSDAGPNCVVWRGADQFGQPLP